MTKYDENYWKLQIHLLDDGFLKLKHISKKYPENSHAFHITPEHVRILKNFLDNHVSEKEFCR